MTLAEALNKASTELSAAGITNARLDADMLLRHALVKDRAWLLAHIQDELPNEARRLFEGTIARRLRREPLQYIIGTQEFWGLAFKVTPDVLIPRPETELIIETVLSLVQNRDASLRIIDLCTGSGCIAVSLAKELQHAQILASDKSTGALGIARENADRHGVSERIRFLESDLFVSLEKHADRDSIDIIVSNPPYVPAGDFSTLQPEVRDFEPKMALVAGNAGIDIHERIIRDASQFFKPGGSLIMEMGIGQASKLSELIQRTGGYDPPLVLKDLAGIERVVAAKKR